METSNRSDLLTWLLLGGGVLLVIYVASQSTSTSYGVDPGTASVANTVATTGAANYATQSAAQSNLVNEVVNFAAQADNNQTSIALAANNGADQIQLQSMATQATEQQAKFSTIGKIIDNLGSIETATIGANAADYQAFVNGGTQVQLGQLSSLTQENTSAGNNSAQVEIQRIAAPLAEEIANIQAQSALAIAQTNASRPQMMISPYGYGSGSIGNQGGSPWYQAIPVLGSLLGSIFGGGAAAGAGTAAAGTAAAAGATDGALVFA